MVIMPNVVHDVDMPCNFGHDAQVLTRRTILSHQMPQSSLPASAEGLPLTRRDIEQHVDALIDLLDTLDGDPDLEPAEDDEPDADGESSLGWTTEINQTKPAWQANYMGMLDLEDGVGAVRKQRPPSLTGGAVFRGAGVLSGSAPPDPRDCGRFTLPMARPKGRAGR